MDHIHFGGKLEYPIQVLVLYSDLNISFQYGKFVDSSTSVCFGRREEDFGFTSLYFALTLLSIINNAIQQQKDFVSTIPCYCISINIQYRSCMSDYWWNWPIPVFVLLCLVSMIVYEQRLTLIFSLFRTYYTSRLIWHTGKLVILVVPYGWK